MTESEAIEKLRAYYNCQRLQLKSIYEDCNDELCDSCNLCYAQGTTGEHIKSIEIAIQALEKQIPKKPIFANNMMTKDKFLMCPCCEFRFPDSLVFLKTRCWNCGQKLDWSDEE